MLTFQNQDAHAVRLSFGPKQGCTGPVTCLNSLDLQVVKKNLGPEAASELKDLDFLPFPDLEAGASAAGAPAAQLCLAKLMMPSLCRRAR